MKKLIFIAALFISAASFGQGNWTLSGAKNRWANGMGFGNKDTSTYTNASDTNLLILQYPGVLVYRHLLTDYWEILSYNSKVSNYKLISDSLFNAGYTRRDRTKQGLDSLGALKLNISDTAAALANYPLKDGTRATGTWNIGITGNAGTATLLQTARNINGVSFNGSADITVTAAAGTLTGSTLNSSVTGSSLTSVGTIGTGVWQGTAIADSYISSASTWNAKQSQLNGTGFVKASGTSISYDNTPYMPTSGGDFTGSITIPNAYEHYYAKNSSGSAVNMMYMAFNNSIVIGSNGYNIYAKDDFIIDSSLVVGGTITGAGTGLTGTASGLSIGGNAATVTNGIYTTSSFNLGTTSIALNRASGSQTLTGVSIDGTAASETLSTVATRGNSYSGSLNLGSGTRATVGDVLNFANNKSIAWRNAANSADLQLFVNGSDVLRYTGNGLFDGSLTASSLIKSGGTSSQLLAADGSVVTAGTNITISGATISASGGLNGNTGIISAQTTDQTITTYTPGSNGVYLVGGTFDVTAISGSNMEMYVEWTDQNSVSRSFALRSGVSAIQNNVFAPFSVTAKSGTAINIKVHFLSGSSATYDASAYIKSMN